jgi:dTMP kinase
VAGVRLITIEGIDGAGKTTLAAMLAAELEQRGIPFALLREPGGVRAAEQIRNLVKDPALHIGPAAEALLYAAARAQLVEEAIQPLLDEGTWVLLDRFVDSSLAYQGAGRGLGIDAVGAINRFATRGLVPDRTLLIVIDPGLARERAHARAEPVDRLEREQQDFFVRIDRAYRDLAAQEPGRIRMIDGALSPDELLARAMSELDDLL